MKFDPDTHHRRSIRMKGWDYSQPGAYFVTVDVQDWTCLFGDVLDNRMVLNEPGRAIEIWWVELRKKFGVALDEYVIMPNHMHGIIVIDQAGQINTLGDMVQWFKTMSTNEYIRGVKEKHWPGFNKRLWQRDYFEHIIRDEEDMARVRKYIADNPGAWMEEKIHP